jgi:pimeloyl-ACP methyl ester carboxylesterase
VRCDLKKITVPTLVLHGDDDRIVPYADSAPLPAELLENGAGVSAGQVAREWQQVF